MDKEYILPAPVEQDETAEITLPGVVAGSGALKAYAKDWANFTRWCRMKGAEPLPPPSEMIGLYLADLAAPTNGSPALSVSTIERRLSGLAWNYTQRGFTLDRKNRHIATVLRCRKKRFCGKTSSP